MNHDGRLSLVGRGMNDICLPLGYVLQVVYMIELKFAPFEKLGILFTYCCGLRLVNDNTKEPS